MYSLLCLLPFYMHLFCRWESLGSPHKLAWYWLQVLEKWTKEQVKPLGEKYYSSNLFVAKTNMYDNGWIAVYFKYPFQVSPKDREELEFLLLLEELGSEGITENVIKVTHS